MMMNTLEQEDLIKGLPDDALIQYMQNPSGQLAQYLVASEIQHRTDMRNRFAAQEQQTEQTVAEQIVAEASPQQGIAALPPQMPPQAPMGAMPPSMQMQQPQMPPEMMAAQMPPAAPQPQEVMMAGGGPIPGSIIEDASKFSPESLYDIDPVQQSAMLNATNMGIPSVLPMARGGVVRMVRGGDVEVAKEEYERIVKENTDEDGNTNWRNVLLAGGLGLSAGLTFMPTPMTKGIGAMGTTAIQAIQKAPKLFRGIASLGRSVPASLRGLQNRMYTRLGQNVARGRNIPVPGARHPSLQPIPRSLRGELSPSAYARLGRENILEGLQQSILQPIRRVTREGLARGAGITGLGAVAYEYLGGLEERDIERLRELDAAGYEIPPHLRQQYLDSPNKLRGGTTLPAMFGGGVVKMRNGSEVSLRGFIESVPETLDPREQIDPNQFNPIPTSPLSFDPIGIVNPDPRVREQERNARFFGMTREQIEALFPGRTLGTASIDETSIDETSIDETSRDGISTSFVPTDRTLIPTGEDLALGDSETRELSEDVKKLMLDTSSPQIQKRINELEKMRGATPETFDITESVLRSGKRADERAISQALINLGAGIAAGDISKGFTDAGTAVSGIRQRQEEFQQLADVRRAEAEAKASSDLITRDIGILESQIQGYGSIQDQRSALNTTILQLERLRQDAITSGDQIAINRAEHRIKVADYVKQIGQFDATIRQRYEEQDDLNWRAKYSFMGTQFRYYAPEVIALETKMSQDEKDNWQPSYLPDKRKGWTITRHLDDLLAQLEAKIPEGPSDDFMARYVPTLIDRISTEQVNPTIRLE